MRITLIRHAESKDNAANIYGGQSDSGLTDRGRRQSAYLATQRERFDDARIIASDLARATETLHLVLGAGVDATLDLNRQEYTDASRWSRLTADRSTGEGDVSLATGDLVEDTTVIESLTVQVVDDIDVETTGTVRIDSTTSESNSGNSFTSASATSFRSSTTSSISIRLISLASPWSLRD